MTAATLQRAPSTVDLLTRARHLIEAHGHTTADFGSPAAGFSLEGAMYRAAGFWAGRIALRNPEPHEMPMWHACNDAFVAVCQALEIRLLYRQSQAYIEVCEANERLSSFGAAKVLHRAAELQTRQPAGVAS